MASLKTLTCAIIVCFSLQLLQAQTPGAIKKKDPWRLIGNIGTSANFYKSNEGDFIPDERNYTRPYFAWNAYGSMIAKTKDFSIPISFVINQYSRSTLKPYFQMGISPTYKWAKIHLGYRSLSFSPLTYEGLSFKGAGIELNPKLFRFAAFYGRLNKPVAENSDTNNYRMTQYARTGYGVKIGIGSNTNYLDFMYFHAKDDTTTSRPDSALSAQENAVLGSSFRLTFFKRVTLSGDVAVSGITRDLSFTKLPVDSADRVFKDVVGKFLNYNASSLASYAGQSALSVNFKGFNSHVGYRRVQPDFRSLGTLYLINDVELITWNNNVNLANGKVGISTNFSTQHNNLLNNLLSTLQTQVASINLYTMVDEHTSLNFNYSGYDYKQKNGKMVVKDSFRLDQKTSQFTFNPSYNITAKNLLHYVSGSLNLSFLKDLSPLKLDSLNTTNISGSLNYNLNFINKPYSFWVNGLLSKYKQSINEYISYGATFGTSAQLLKKKNLNLQGSIGYLLNQFSTGNTKQPRQKNLTYSFGLGYQVRKHTLNAFANYVFTPTTPNNQKIVGSIPSAVASRNLASGISYTYSF